MSGVNHLTEETTKDAIDRLRRAADALAAGDEKEAGSILLAGLKPVANDLKHYYGPMVNLMVKGWLRAVFG